MILANALLNIIFSIILGKLVGVAGVYIATIISDILTDFWFDAKLIYNKLFERNDCARYLLYIIANALAVIVLVAVLKKGLAFFELTIITWFLKALITAVIFLGIFLIVYGRTNTFKVILQTYILGRLKSNE